jgi:aminoglycoside phosphotransferase (APT) family kinase protein
MSNDSEPPITVADEPEAAGQPAPNRDNSGTAPSARMPEPTLVGPARGVTATNELDGLDPAAVLAAFGLHGPVTSLTEVDGGWSNRVFRLEADSGVFAVKQMCNPRRLPHWEGWLAEACAFELSAIEAGIAAPEPLVNSGTGGCLAWVSAGGSELTPVRLHRWVNGKPLAAGVADPQVARWAGQVLATMHGMQVRPRDRSLFPFPNTDTAQRWPELTEAAYRSGAAWAGLMAAVAPSVSVIAELVKSDGHRPDQEVMSHGDLDQKNILTTRQGPVLCDWDVAYPVVPSRELADVAMSMGCWRDMDAAREVVKAYRAHGGDDTALAPADLGQTMMSRLDWIALNADRELGQWPASAAEVAQARKLLPRLLAKVQPDLAVALRITGALRT